MRLDERLKVIYETIAPTITRSEEAWKNYLQFGSAVYKHQFDNALLVYAQNRKATMLATFDTWKNPKVGRSVSKGEKGIAVCEYANAKNTIKHLYDVSQTNGAKIPDVWKLDDELRQGLINRLSYNYDIKAESLTDCLIQIIADNVSDSFEDYVQGFENDIKGHFLSDMPREGFVAELTETVYSSCVYYVAHRCGETADVTMPTISHFDTVPLVARLGQTVTELSKGILLEIERNVKILENERSAKNERRHLEQQGTSSSVEQLAGGRNIRGRQGLPPRQVRQNGDEPSARNQPPKVFTFEDAGRAYRPDVPGGRGSDGTVGENLSKAVGERPNAENRRHHGTDTPLEQTQGHSGGNRNQRNGTDTEITETEGEPQGSFSLPEIYQTPNKNIPYRLGDIVSTLKTKGQATIARITDTEVFFHVPGEENKKTVYRIERSQFEVNLEAGAYHSITSGDTELYIDPEEISPTDTSEPQSTTIPQDNEPADGSFFMPVDDEQIIKAYLLRGSGYQDSKNRIADFADTKPTTADFARFLKDEYGTGGSSGYDDVPSSNHDSKGITLSVRDSSSENGKREITLTWNNVAKRITELINSGEYLPGRTAPAPAPEGSPLWRQYTELSERYPDSIMFRRLGDFYEVMGEKANTVADELGFTLTSRDVGLTERVPLIGIPVHTLETVIAELVKKGYKVALADAYSVTERTPAVSVTEEPATEISKPNEKEDDVFTFPNFDIATPMVQQTLFSLDEQIRLDSAESETQKPRSLWDRYDFALYQEYLHIFARLVSEDENYRAAFGIEGNWDGIKESCKAALDRNVADLSEAYATLAEAYNSDPELNQWFSQRVFEESYSAVGKEMQAKKDTPTPKPPRTRTPNTAAHRNYKAFAALFPQITDGTYRYLRLESEGFEPLSIERLGGSQYSIMHTFIQNGDLMRDPDMVIEIDTAEQTIQALSYELSGMGVYQDVYANETLNTKLQRELNSFLSDWLRNIGEQGYMPVRAISRGNDTDTEITFDGKGNPVTNTAEPAQEIPNESNPSVRLYNELLNAHNGQTDCRIQAFMGKDQIGVLFYSVFENTPRIENIEVYEDYRRQGVATAMVRHLANQFPDVEIEWSLLTDDGMAFYDAVTYEVENEEYTEAVNRLTEINAQLSEYESLYNEGTAAVPNDVSEVWNGLHDEKYDIENRLAELNSTKTFIRLDDEPVSESVADISDTAGITDGSGGVVETPAAAPKIKLLPQAPPAPEKINYRYSEADNLFTGGAKTKFRNNIEAIRLVKHLETENRLATPDEQKILANYVGWGGLANAFSKTAAGWENEYQELKLILDDEEYKAAMNSTITAFYTEPRIAEHMHRALINFGFEGGPNRTILEPAMGTGNFFSVLPDKLQGTKLHGVELDSISGKIAGQLYPTADIKIQGFEITRFEDNSIDVITGNIPFNNIRVYDRRYEEENFLIHDYFIAKSLDLLKPGGIAAVITSKGTMDKADPSAREYFAQRADLIGAVRLPNNAFKALSGTEVTADILFFQKLDQPRAFDKYEAPDWVYTDSMPPPHYFRVNQYFIDNPDMILGTMTRDHRMYGNQDGTACVAPEGQDLYAELERAIGTLSAVFNAQSDPEVTELLVESSGSPDEEKIAADTGTKNYTYVIKDNEVYFCEGGYLTKQELKNVRAERVKGLCGIRAALLDVIGVQSREWGYEYSELETAQRKLNEVYDAFVKKYGYINDKANSAVFGNDDQYPLLRSIEDLNDDRTTYSKAPIFTRATIKSYRQPTHAENAKEALEISLNVKLKVDLAYMAYLYEKPEDEIIAELGDRIYLNPQSYYGNPHEGWETAEEYLSGDVVSKLDYARLKSQDNEMFTRNVTALQDVQPPKLLPSDIDFRIGSPWIPIEYYRQFMYETLETPAYLKPTDYTGSDRIELSYLEFTDTWRISNKGRDADSIKANQTYGTKRANAYEIYEDCLNMQSVTIRDPVEYFDKNGEKRTKYVINANETMIARSKQQQIKEAFGSWLFADKDRAEILLDMYNERFNRIRPREYDGSHLRFDGMSEERELRKHQQDVIARIVYHGTCLMAHEVGAGKTAAMIAAGMYMKNMGVIKKPIYVVPNHLIEQWSNEFMRFFPSANILATTKADFEKKNRNKFVSKIAMGDYDAIIIGHSQFERIPVSRERQERLLNEEISSLTRIIDQMKAEKGENWAIKQIVIFQNNLKGRLERLIKEERKDDLLNFEQLGVDYLFVDEAHVYKNCYTYTKMRNVAGIGQSKSQRASDMLMKCQYLQEVNKGRGLTFATGTPISNSMSEMYVMQRFLQPDILKKTGLHFFDKWAATFGDTISSLEINPEGSGYRIKNRFSKFHNLPELMKIFRIIADIKTGDMLNLPVPELDGGKAQVIVTERSDFQTEIMESFVKRAEDIRTRKVEPEEDNMLKLTNEAKLMAIDPRLVYPDAPNDPDSKLNTCIRNVYGIWKETTDARLTQVIFCDSGTPKPGQFNVYDEVKEQLIKMGVPADEIAFVHDAKNDAQREVMFEKTRKGEIRVLLGSTGKLGTGTNIQTRLYALHHLDVPWRPSDIIQRDGRGLRFGNDNGVIRIFRYVTKDTFDAYLWQIQEQKLRYITQIMTSKSVSRSCEDTDETVLTAAEIKAIATSNPLLAEKMNVDNEVTRLKLLKGNWTNERIVLERNINKHYPKTIAQCEERKEKITCDIAVLKKHKGGDFIIEVDGRKYDERAVAGEALLTVIRAKCEVGQGQYHVGNYCGLELHAERKSLMETEIRLVGSARYTTSASESAIGCISRIENLAERLPGFLTETENNLNDTRHQLEVAKQSVTKPFEYEEKLSEYLTRQSEINTTLEFKELSKQQDEFLNESGSGEAVEAETEDEYEDEHEDDGIAV